MALVSPSSFLLGLYGKKKPFLCDGSLSRLIMLRTRRMMVTTTSTTTSPSPAPAPAPAPAPSNQHREQNGGGTGVVLMNLGGPSTLKEVRGFLERLFSDRDLIPLPFQSILAPFIALRRTKRIEQQYHEIGGGSPIRHWTDKQGAALCKLLDKLSPASAPHRHYIAFRYAEPLTTTTVQQMRTDGITRAVAFTQYPQYSCSTTGSSLNELHRVLKDLDPGSKIAWKVIDRWPTHGKLVEVR